MGTFVLDVKMKYKRGKIISILLMAQMVVIHERDNEEAYQLCNTLHF